MKKFLISNLKFAIILSIVFLAGPAHAATLYSQAANQDVYQGQTFVVDWYLDTENQSINAVNLSLNFSTNTLEVVDANPGNSLLNLWIKNPSFDNQKGTINLIGGVSNGVRSATLPIFRVEFMAKASGEASITLDPSSQVLLNDGLGSASVLKFKNELFNIYPKNFAPVQITSPTHPNPDAWYVNHDVVIKFLPAQGMDYSYSFSSNIDVIPDNTSMTVPWEISYINRPDGVYYFKLDSKIGTNNWQEAGVFRVQIDSRAPEAFEPIIGSDPNIFGGKKFVSFSTVDKTSGISHYKVKFGWFDSGKSTQNTYFPIPKFFLGNQITVSAYDNAGNVRRETLTYRLYPDWVMYVMALLLLVILILILKWMLKKFKPKTKPSDDNFTQQKN
jgi:hypothetical protein